MNRNGPLHADPVGQTAHGDGLVDAGTTAGNHSSLEGLHTLTVSFHDPEVQTDEIADLHVVVGVSQLRLFHGFDNVTVHDCVSPLRWTFMHATAQRTVRNSSIT